MYVFVLIKEVSKANGNYLAVKGLFFSLMGRMIVQQKKFSEKKGSWRGKSWQTPNMYILLYFRPFIRFKIFKQTMILMPLYLYIVLLI